MTVLFRRPNGTFVITHPETGYPYHVLADDPLFAVYAQEAAAAPLETPPPPVVILPKPAPTKAELLAELAALQAKIEAMP